MSVVTWRAACRSDLQANTGYPKSQVTMLLFRTTQELRTAKYRGLRLLYPPAAVIYKVFTEWILGIELPPRTKVGAGLMLRHGVGLVVNPNSIIGDDVMLRHGVTIGNRRSETDCPTIGDRVEIGAGAIIIGALHVGADSRIGAGCLVINDIPPGSTVYSSREITVTPRRDLPA